MFEKIIFNIILNACKIPIFIHILFPRASRVLISLKFITRQVRRDAREILEIVIENFKCRRYVCTSFKGEDSKS